MSGTYQDEFGTTENYEQAFSDLLREGISDKHLAMLRAHHAAPAHTVSWVRVAEVVGYASGSAVNVQYGTLAKRVAHTLGIFEPPRGAWIFVLVDWGNHLDEDTGYTTFELRRPVVEALERLGIVTAGADRPSGASRLPEHEAMDYVETRRAALSAIEETTDSCSAAVAQKRDPWIISLRAFIARRCGRARVPDRTELTLAEEWQCHIIGNSLATWLRQDGQHVVARRAALATSLEFELDPVVLFTTNTPGLVAAREILGEHHARVVWMSNEEFEAFEATNPSDRFACHVHVWSFFVEPPEKKFASRARAEHPLPPGSQYWQHVIGTMWSRRAGQGHDDLWSWDGVEPGLLEEEFARWIA